MMEKREDKTVDLYTPSPDLGILILKMFHEISAEYHFVDDSEQGVHRFFGIDKKKLYDALSEHGKNHDYEIWDTVKGKMLTYHKAEHKEIKKI